MGRVLEYLIRRPSSFTGLESKAGTIEVVSRTFDILRCFDSLAVRLGNGDLSARCNLPRSTVSRLTQSLTRMGLLVYLRDNQKYRIGPSAIAMCLSMTQNSDLHERIRSILRNVADRIPCMIALAIPDRIDVTFIEAATSTNLLCLRARKGNRVSIARTAAGHAYAAALDPLSADHLLLQIDQGAPKDAERLRSRLEPNRLTLKERGSLITCGLFRAHLNGIAVPFWSSLYGTYVVLTMGVLAADYDEPRMQNELAPIVLHLSVEVQDVLDSSEVKLKK